jgi:hypothetical protein
MAASMAVLEVRQFAAYSRFTQTPNYIDSDAPPIEFSLWLSFRGVILCSWMTNDTGGMKVPLTAGDFDPSGRQGCEVTQTREACAAFLRPDVRTSPTARQRGDRMNAGMSALGQKQTYAVQNAMSALPQ